MDELALLPAKLDPSLAVPKPEEPDFEGHRNDGLDLGQRRFCAGVDPG